jgi:hypothetical protein
VIGYVAPQTKSNEEYVVAVKVQKWLDQGKSKEQIFLSWNAGERATKCSKGINKKGVPFDSCQYIKKASDHYALIN